MMQQDDILKALSNVTEPDLEKRSCYPEHGEGYFNK